MGVENQASHFESDNQFPSNVLRGALSKINSRGEVILLDEENGEQFPWPPHQPFALETLPKDIYNHKLLVVARLIHGAVFQIQSFPDLEESILQNLAISLTSYRYSPEFLAEAASLIRLDENGFLYDPHLPPNDPNL